MATQYLGLARKYRPQKFSDVVGQDAVVATLLKALQSGRIADAYLFSGTRGTGKTTLARLLAKALNCASPEKGEPCNTCHFCKEIASGRHLDVIEIDGASHRGIDDIRDLQDTLRYPPTEAKVKVIIIDEVHMLTKEAFNALLKTLEEPPLHVKFFFATTEIYKLPATILSRCQRYPLQRISLENLTKRMAQILDTEKLSYQMPALYFIAELAQGSLRDALSLLDQVFARSTGEITLTEVRSLFGFIPRRKLFTFDQALLTENLSTLLLIASEIFEQGMDLKDWITALGDHYRIYLQLLTNSSPASFHTFENWEIEEYSALLPKFSVGYCLDLLEKILDWQKRELLEQRQKGYFELLHCDLMRSKGKLRLDQWLQLKIAEKPSQTQSVQTNEPQTSSTAAVPEQVTPTAIQIAPQQISSEQAAPVQAIPVHAPIQKPIEPVAALGKAPSAHPQDALDDVARQRFETLLRFASVELEGIIKTKSPK